MPGWETEKMSNSPHTARLGEWGVVKWQALRVWIGSRLTPSGKCRVIEAIPDSRSSAMSTTLFDEPAVVCDGGGPAVLIFDPKNESTAKCT